MSRARIILIVAILSLLLGAAALWQWRAHERDGSAALARGLTALDKGDARTARVELMNAIKADPRSAVARAAQARALVELGDGAGAQAEIERARKLGAAVAETRDVMAQALLLQGEADAALREARAPDVPAAQSLAAARIIARAAMAQGDVGAAQSVLARALDGSPNDVESWVILGRLRLTTGDQAGAIGAADRAVALAPTDGKALTLRAELTRGQYGLTASRPWFERALAANPESVPTLEQYAATLADAGEAGAMLSLTRRILALEPDNPRAWMMQAVMAARAGKADLARALLARTQGRLDGEPATMLVRGVLHLQEGNAVLAAEALGPLVAMQPDNRPGRVLLARAYQMGSDMQAAATTLAPIVAQRDADPYVLTLAGRVQEALGNRAMAADMLARAAWPVRASADPFAGPRDRQLADGPAPANTGTARDNIPYIRALLSTNRIDAALERARLLRRANAGAPDAWIVLGDTLGEAGRAGEAARAYESAANIRFDRAVALRLVAAWTRAGDPARATQIVQLFLAQNPADSAMRRLAAAFAMNARDWRGARRMLQAVRTQVGDNDALLMADLARVALETGDRTAARAYAAHAYRLMPANPMIADIYGWALLQTGEKGPMTVDVLEKAVALAPGHPLLNLHLGQAYAAAGRKSDAKLALGRAVSVRNFAGRQDAVDALAAL